MRFPLSHRQQNQAENHELEGYYTNNAGKGRVIRQFDSLHRPDRRRFARDGQSVVVCFGWLSGCGVRGRQIQH